MNRLFKVLFTCILIVNCSRTELTPYRPIDAVPQWFRVDENFALRTDIGDYELHPFFDLTPVISYDDLSINFILLTPEKSDFFYQFDLVSGKRVLSGRYCQQEDVWKKYYHEIHRPTFTEGIIPRLLNPLGEPQKIIVFGRRDFYYYLSKSYSKTHRARVVGGINLQYCPKKSCRSRDWISTILPVAVDMLDPDFKDVDNLEELKDEVNWNYVIAFLQNAKGRSIRKLGDAPSYRYLSEINQDKTFEYMFKKGYLFKFPKMMKMRKSCHTLYKYIWDEVNNIRVAKSVKFKTDEQKVAHFKKQLFERNIISQEEVDSKKLKEEKTYQFKRFSKWFEKFYQDYGDDYEVCSRYVRSANIEVNKKRHWFFAYLDLFFKMQKVGYVYSCANQSWIENYKRANGNWLYEQGKALKECTDYSLDRAFEQAVNYMVEKERNNEDHFRFVSEDSVLGGSHQKVYAWVNFTGKKMRCEETEDSLKNQELSISEIFRQGEPWDRFTEERKSFYDIIR